MRQTNKIRKGIAWLLCTVLVLGILPMLPQMSMQISAAENAASVFVDGVELHAGGKKYFKNGDTADSGAVHPAFALQIIYDEKIFPYPYCF